MLWLSLEDALLVGRGLALAQVFQMKQGIVRILREFHQLEVSVLEFSFSESLNSGQEIVSLGMGGTNGLVLALLQRVLVVLLTAEIVI